MSDYDHPREYDDDERIAALEDLVDDSSFEEERRIARREADEWRRAQEVDAGHDRDLERDTIDRINEGRP